ncbi:MAG: bifunctional demethylmenaquinone methyltransferase/2-methoxy-6-polyprenyl-1,4-benzoquinol methylase UbiE [Rhodospirillales bacterium]|nr:bifunctional demethylmenaquinone methyltransferase/2-methoxy-6-polyprenyl-1,4-benzoquinol methylase UbiE [Rhodospirillales bacterium]
MSVKNMNAQTTTHFGFRDVPDSEKASLVKGVFDSVASNYDFMNDLMSLGVHRLWKNTLVESLRPHPRMRLLDVGGGTGDIAFRFLDKGGEVVTVCDINQEMLKQGRDRAINRGHLKGLSWVTGDAENLPVDDHSVDAYTIAFCIRNVTHIDRALAEARRVLKPGGRFLCLEFSRIALPLLEKPYDLYSFKILPWMGQAFANDRAAYQYLAESIRRFPDQQRFAQMITDAGLSRVSHRNLSGGVAAIHSAWRV